MGTSTILLILGMIALGFFTVRFGMAMRDLEQRVSDLQDRMDRVASS